MSVRHQWFPIEDSSQVAAARRLVAASAAQQGLGEVQTGNASIAVTEAGMNILKHGGGGGMHLRVLEESEGAGIELVAIDAGPGIEDWAKCLEDGYSTAGTPGNGLGAMRRLSTEFDVYSRPGKGSAFRMAFRAGNQPARADAAQLGAICLPLKGFEVSGDNWAAALGPARSVLMIADGLGHGLNAATASGLAVQSFRARPALEPAQMLAQLHADLRQSVGAVVGIASLMRGADTITYSGIGNIAARVVRADGEKQFASMPGIVGQNMRKVSSFEQPWDAGALLVMHSDGLSARWSLDDYPGLAVSHPALVAAVLHRDLARGRDDVTVLAFREGR